MHTRAGKIFAQTIIASVIAVVFAASASAAEVRCHILTINDPHSYILPYTEAENISSERAVKTGGLCRALYLLKNEEKIIKKSSENDPVFLIEGGDIMLGKKGSLFNGSYEYKALQLAGFDVGVLGNHDFDGGVKTLAALGPKLRFPVLASNVKFNDETIQKYYRKTVVIEKNGVKIGCFGFVPPDLQSIIADPSGFNVDQDIVSLAKKRIAELRSQGVDIIVAVDHIGLDRDLDLAKKVSGIDVIVGGHSHDAVRNKVIITGPDGHQTIYAQAGLDGRYAGHFEIVMKDGHLDPEKSSWKLLEVTPDTPEIKEIGDIGRNAQKKLAETLKIGNPIATFTKPADARFSYIRFSESGIGDLVADSLRWKTKAQVGIINSGGLRIGRIIPAGTFTPGDMLDLFPYGNKVILVSVTGAEIRKQLEVSASSIKADDENFDASMRAEHGEFLQISGLRVTYDLAAKPAIVINRKIVQPGSRVSDVMVQTKAGWVPLNDNDVYTVGTIDYAAKFWDVLSSKDVNTTEMAALDDYFGEVLHRRTAPKTDGRIRILKGL
jgi:5'-nucleotidase/UDP-sugar diphosphatase